MNDYYTAGFVEYLLYFQGKGEYRVSVKFSGELGGEITSLRSSLPEVMNLLEILSQHSSGMMLFDEHPGQVKELRINPKTKKVTFIVNLLKSPR